jgi:lipopolysaccharide export system protein LptA
MSLRYSTRYIFGVLSVLVLVALAANPTSAQAPSTTFGGLSENSNEPIDIESDMLTVYDAKKYATFKGDVKAVQGTTTLRAAELDVHYVGGTDKLTGQQGQVVPTSSQASPQGAKDTEQTQISKIEARGNVVITSEDDQTTSSDWALYDVPAKLVTVGGNVVLTQGQNVLKGDRLVIDLTTGESRFENKGNTAAGGRIRALFMPKASPAASGAESASSPATGNEDPKPAGASPAQAEQAPADNEAGFDSGEPMPLVPEFR